MLLVLIVAGTAMALQAAEQAHAAGVQLMTIAFATSGALAGLIVSVGPLSGGHFNPLITLLQWHGGQRGALCTAAYIAAQLVGAALGAVCANALHPAALHLPARHDITASLCLSEFVASAGLLLIVQACARTSASAGGPFAVAGWLGGAIIATPTLSLANPAICVASLVANGPMALRPADVALFAVLETAGAVVAFVLFRILFAPPVEVGVDVEGAHSNE